MNKLCELLKQFPEYDNGFDSNVYYKEVAFYKHKNTFIKTTANNSIHVTSNTSANIYAKADSIRKINYDQSKALSNNNSLRTTKVAKTTREKVWQHLGLDSLHFVEMYGSEKEYNIEESQKYQSSHGRLVLLIGVEKWWIDELSTFLQSSGYYEDDASEVNTTGTFQFAFKERIALGHKPQKIVATAFVNKLDDFSLFKLLKPLRHIN